MAYAAAWYEVAYWLSQAKCAVTTTVFPPQGKPSGERPRFTTNLRRRCGRQRARKCQEWASGCKGSPSTCTRKIGEAK